MSVATCRASVQQKQVEKIEWLSSESQRQLHGEGEDDEVSIERRYDYPDLVGLCFLV